MIVNSARFVISNSDPSKCPEEMRHEFAFIGRSNVGKSSLINMLTGNGSLAMTSSTPGKTLLINHFLINNQWYLVDLPGYGYARRSQQSRQQIVGLIRTYILRRRQMTCLFLLVDGRHQPQRIDLEFMRWLGENSVPFCIVFTKLDKLSSTAAKTSTANYCAALLEEWEELPPVFRTSAVDRRGRDEILSYIEQLCKLPLEEDDPAADQETNDREENHQDANDTKQNENINPQQPIAITEMSNQPEKKQCCCCGTPAEEKKEQREALRDYPGAAIDAADDEKVTRALEKERTKTLGENPRADVVDDGR